MYLSRNGVTANAKLVGRLHAAPSGVRNGRRDECGLKLVSQLIPHVGVSGRQQRCCLTLDQAHPRRADRRLPE